MAGPATVTKTFWDGTRGMVRWYTAWSDGTQLTDSTLVDISTLGGPIPNSIKIRSIDLVMNGDMQVDLEYDATTDELIDRFIGQSDVSYQFLCDYTDGPNVGYIADTSAAGFTGDLLLTTVGAASGDEINLLLVFERSS
jgi:hypothetical protein